MNNRDASIDLLKIISCVAVVGLHTINKDASSMNSVLYYLCGFAVPMFFCNKWVSSPKSGGVALNIQSTKVMEYFMS